MRNHAAAQGWGAGGVMSEMGQTEKNSARANVFRVTPESGHCATQSACLKGADSVEKGGSCDAEGSVIQSV